MLYLCTCSHNNTSSRTRSRNPHLHVTLLLFIASAGLLSPDGFTISATDSDGGMPAMGIGLLALGSIAIIASVFGQSETQKLAAAKNDDELEEANRRLMDEFDKKLKGPR